MHIELALTKAVSLTYHREASGLVPFEIIIQENSIVQFLGFHYDQSGPGGIAEPTLVDFTSIKDATGFVRKLNFFFAILYFSY